MIVEIRLIRFNQESTRPFALEIVKRDKDTYQLNSDILYKGIINRTNFEHYLGTHINGLWSKKDVQIVPTYRIT